MTFQFLGFGFFQKMIERIKAKFATPPGEPFPIPIIRENRDGVSQVVNVVAGGVVKDEGLFQG